MKRQLRQSALLRFYHQYLSSADAARYVMDVTGTYQVAGLERLYEYGSRNLRRAAILALGMIGDYPTRNVLSRALHDTDRAVRMLAEDALPDIWARAGNAHQQHQLAQLTAYNSGGGTWTPCGWPKTCCGWLPNTRNVGINWELPNLA
ncbi:MAG: HEAT repeat domain-containing protein [Planctomycetales bacterium]|nr:HEAT repeat domain-containing protein [Planctomycetales bacterium]